MEKDPSFLFSGIHFNKKKFFNDFAKFQVIINSYIYIYIYILLPFTVLCLVSEKVGDDKSFNIVCVSYRRRKGVI